MNAARPKILLVEDDANLAELIRYNFAAEGFDITHTSDGDDALLLVHEDRPDLVLLDWMVEGASGIEVCRRLRRAAESASLPIIMLTARADEGDRVRGLETGADDYVTKPFSPRQVVARVHAVLRRAGSLPPDVLRFDGDYLAIDTVSRSVTREGKPVTLTPSEYSLLFTLASHPGRTYTRDELIGLALKDDFEGFDRVIDTHMKNLRQKIEPDAKKPRYLVTVHGVGYRFDGGRT